MQIQAECVIYPIPSHHLAEMINVWVEALLNNRHEMPEGLPLAVGVSGDMGMTKPEAFAKAAEDPGHKNVVALKPKVAPPPRTVGRITMKALLEARAHVEYKQARIRAYDAGFRLDVGANWQMPHALGAPNALEDAAKDGVNPLMDEKGFGGMIATELNVVLLPFEMAAATKLEAVSEIK